jgi:hypothetical protein
LNLPAIAVSNSAVALLRHLFLGTTTLCDYEPDPSHCRAAGDKPGRLIQAYAMDAAQRDDRLCSDPFISNRLCDLLSWAVQVVMRVPLRLATVSRAVW